MADEIGTIAPPDEVAAPVDPTLAAAENQKFATGTEGFARGLTGGLSDLYLTKDLGVDPKYIKARQEANPILSTVSGMAGQIPGLAALGPVEGVAGNAAVGAALSVPDLITDHALGDPDLNAEKILTHIGFGAALGAGIGKLMGGAAEKIASPVTESLEKATGSSALETLSKTDMAQGFMRGLQGLPAEDLETPIRKMTQNLQDVYNTSSEAVKKMYNESMASEVKQGLEKIPLEQAQENAFNIYNKIEGVANELKGEEYTPVARKIFGNKVAELQNDLVGAKSSHDIYTSLNDFVKEFSGKSGLIKWSATPSASDVATQDLLRSVNKTVRSALSDSNMWGEKTASAYKGASDLYHEFIGLKSDHGFDAAFTRQTPQGRVIDPAKVSTFFKNYSAPGQDIKKDVLENFFDVSKRIADASENYEGYQAAKDSISERFSKLSKEHEQMGQLADAMGRKTGDMHLPFGLEKFSPYNVGRGLHAGIQGIKTAGKIISDISGSIDKGAQKVFSAEKSSSSATMNAMSKTQYNKASERIQDLSNPHELINHLDKNMGVLKDALPNIAPFMTANVQRGIQFLQSKIPQPASQLPLDGKFEATPDQISKFGEYYNTVNDPIRALKQIKQGTLSNETMETLTTVYPQLLHEMRVSLTGNMGKAKGMPYTTKIALAKFMGQPLDSFQMPHSMLANQAAINSPAKSLQNSAQQMKPTVGGMKEMKMSRNASTPLRRAMSDDNHD